MNTTTNLGLQCYEYPADSDATFQEVQDAICNDLDTVDTQIVEIDDTLTVSGSGADSKTVGDLASKYMHKSVYDKLNKATDIYTAISNAQESASAAGWWIQTSFDEAYKNMSYDFYIRYYTAIGDNFSTEEKLILSNVVPDSCVSLDWVKFSEVYSYYDATLIVRVYKPESNTAYETPTTGTVSRSLDFNYFGYINLNISYSPILKHKAKLEDNTWTIIDNIADNGLASDYWAIGDTKSILLTAPIGVLNQNITVNSFIVHMTSYGVTFMIGKDVETGNDIALVDTSYNDTNSKGFCMNLTETNLGGWMASYMRNTLLGNNYSLDAQPNGTFIGALPEELRNVLSLSYHWNDNTGYISGSTASISTSHDYVFLPTFRNLCRAFSDGYLGAENYVYGNDMFEYFFNGGTLNAYKHSDPTRSTYYWTSSTSGDSQRWGLVTANMSGDKYRAVLCLGIRPCFSVGYETVSLTYLSYN